MLAVIYDNTIKAPNLIAGTDGLEVDLGLSTLVSLSLFTWKGWWGDSYPSEDGYQFGRSRLYELHGQKGTASTLVRAQSLALEALQWLVDENIAGEVKVAVRAAEIDILTFNVQVKRPNNVATEWFGPWQLQLGA